MGMTYTFKDANGNMVFSIEGVNSVSDNEISLESMYSNIVKKGNEISNSLEKINFVSNTRAMEALGYVKGAGFGKNIKNVTTHIGERIAKFFESIIAFFKSILDKINGRINDAAAKRAAAKVVKKLENPTKADEDIELAKVNSIISSNYMGDFVVATKYKNELDKIISKGVDKLHEEDAEKYDEKIKNIKESASKVSDGEKRKAAINFYYQISNSGISAYKSELSRKINELKTWANKVKESIKNVNPSGETANLYSKWYSILTNASKLRSTEEAISSKLILVLSAIDTAKE